MTTQKYTVNQYMIDSVVNWVKSGEIAIPEIQRPFVWDSSKVRMTERRQKKSEKIKEYYFKI